MKFTIKKRILSNKRHLISILLLIFYSSYISQPTFAVGVKPVIDIYKTDQLSLDVVTNKYMSQLQKIADALNSSESIGSNKNANIITSSMLEIITGINKSGNFALVNLSPIMYPNTKIVYFTLDIVDKKDKKRLSYFLPKPKQNIADPDGLVKSWLEYEKIGFAINFKEKSPPKFQSCPALHCLFGFDHPKLKKYLFTFNTLVPKNKKQLILILKNDKDENNRAAAAFLLAHIKNRDELIKILSTSIRDSSGLVRNNVMRVIAETLAEMKNPTFPISEAVVALDFPFADDRNKALFILSSLINQPRYADYILQHAGVELLEELRLSQPNVHDFAYQILKIISGKNFSDHDYTSWELWLKENKKLIV